jgi:hypothetical protein
MADTPSGAGNEAHEVQEPIRDETETRLTATLDRLLESLVWQGEPVELLLRPGLPRDEIERIIRPLPFRLPREVYALYEWRDGTEEKDNWVLPWVNIIPY